MRLLVSCAVRKIYLRIFQPLCGKARREDAGKGEQGLPESEEHPSNKSAGSGYQWCFGAVRWGEAVMPATGDAAGGVCDHKDCRKALLKLLRCSKCKHTSYCSKECQVRLVSCAPLALTRSTDKQHSLSHANSHAPPSLHSHAAPRLRRGRPGTSESAQQSSARQRRGRATGALRSRRHALRARWPPTSIAG